MGLITIHSRDIWRGTEGQLVSDVYLLSRRAHPVQNCSASCAHSAGGRAVQSASTGVIHRNKVLMKCPEASLFHCDAYLCWLCTSHHILVHWWVGTVSLKTGRLGRPAHGGVKTRGRQIEAVPFAVREARARFPSPRRPASSELLALFRLSPAGTERVGDSKGDGRPLGHL